MSRKLIESVDLGKWTEKEIDALLRYASGVEDIGARMDILSGRFLGARYGESTLKGDVRSAEILVINLDSVDCFTFIDYVEAMRLSRSFRQFKKNLKRVRYQSGVVAYNRRNHFFTDWIEFNKPFVEDVTRELGGDKTKTIQKDLNARQDGTLLLEGIEPRTREVSYIPADNVDETLLGRLMTGDYAGIYAEREGLDVSHVGIIIKRRGAVFLRHASSVSSYKKVVDQQLKKYIKGKPGLIVLRACRVY